MAPQIELNGLPEIESQDTAYSKDICLIASWKAEIHVEGFSKTSGMLNKTLVKKNEKRKK